MPPKAPPKGASTKDVEMTFADQQAINTFSRLHNRKQELLSDLKAKSTGMEDYEEASNEIMIQDDETVRYRLGDVFVHLSTDDAETRIREEVALVTEEKAEVEAELAGINAKTAELKTTLYGKFGDNINLEENGPD